MSAVDNQLQALKECYGRVQTLRSLPQTLLALPKPKEQKETAPTSRAQTTPAAPVKYGDLKEIEEMIKSARVQEGLRAAEASEKAEGMAGINVRRKQR